MRAVLAVLVAGLAGLGCDEPRIRNREVAVLEFLIASNGAGHFERVPAYCVGGAEGEVMPERVLKALRPFAERVLRAQDCTYDSRQRDVLTKDDGTPAIWLYVRAPTTEERERFGQRGHLNEVMVNPESLVLAGFYKGEVDSADFLCWTSPTRPYVVRTCDVWRIS